MKKNESPDILKRLFYEPQLNNVTVDVFALKLKVQMQKLRVFSSHSYVELNWDPE